jgi:molybdopterin synthase catalytic subunit
MTLRTALVEQPIDPAALLKEVAHAGAGATCLFLGTVRDLNDGRAVTGIEYTAYRAMAAQELHAIAVGAAELFGTTALVVEHRIGTLALGDISVAIAAAHPHRAQAFDAARMVIEEIKRRTPIWKRERYADGSHEWVDPAHGAAPARTP